MGPFWVGPLLAVTLVLNEIHPDPAGSDTGREFVEILNVHSEGIDLEGFAVEFANGSTGGPWVVRWQGRAGLRLAPGARFLLADRNWAGVATPDTQVWLGLQNGPDAVRLTAGGRVVDLVGYGPLTDPLLMEGTPAGLVTGRSLARRPDGRDTQDNAADFVPADPTPGRPNFLPYDLKIILAGIEPPSLDRPGIPVTASLRIINSGTEPHPAGAVYLTAGEDRSRAYLDALPPDAERLLVFGLVPGGSGTVPLRVELPGTPDEAPSLRGVGRLQIGPGPLVLNEVVSRPTAGQGEWVEVLNTGSGDLQLGAYLLGDADGEWRSLPREVVRPGGVAVLAEDSLALVTWGLDNDRAGAPRICTDEASPRTVRGWPTLNNSAPAARDYADRVILADTTGLVVDHLTLGGTGLMAVTEPEGRSVERQRIRPVNPESANWAPSGAVAGGSPGCPGTGGVPSHPATDLEFSPAVFDRSRVSAVRIRFRVSGGTPGWRARIFDLDGTPVRDLGGDAGGAGPRELIWDGRDDRGRDAGSGAYLVAVRTPVGRLRALLVVR